MTLFDFPDCRRRDSNSQGLFLARESRRPAAPKAAVFADFTTPAVVVVGAHRVPGASMDANSVGLVGASYPIFLYEANAFVRAHHRHHRPVPGAMFSVGVANENGLCGVAVASRPIARGFDDGVSAEITRCCTDGTHNACSMLYAALRKALRALGYERIVTYTLPQEGGASLRAAGFRLDGQTDGGDG